MQSACSHKVSNGAPFLLSNAGRHQLPSAAVDVRYSAVGEVTTIGPTERADGGIA